MSASGKSLLGLWLYRSGEQEWAVKHGSPLHTLRKEHRSLDKSNSESGSEKGSLALSDANSQAMSGDRVSIIFTLKNQVGNLARALQVFQELGINVLHLELSPLEKASNQMQVKPRCEIERHEIDDQDTLICTAFGNPVEADFSWSIKAENDSAEWLGSGERQDFIDKSFYVLDDGYAIARTYRCVANNTVGPGTFCEIEVAVRPKKQLVWWQRWDKTTLIILVASILALLLAVIIICCIIICICRRRRRQDKYRTDVSISATHSVLSYQSNAPQGDVATPALQTISPQPPTTGCLLPNLAAQELPQLPGPKLPPKSPPPKPPSKITPKPSPATTPAHTPTIVTTPTRTPSLRVRHAAQAPKSPPRWPLRPGVMVHVSSDTKENLATNRMTLRPHTLTAQLSNLTTMAAADSSTASSATLNASGFSAATAQTTLLNASTQTVDCSDTGLGGESGDGDRGCGSVDIPKQTSTLGRFDCRQKRAAGVGSEYASPGACSHRTACQTLPHKFGKSSQLRPHTTFNVKPNNQILTVENANTEEQLLTMLTAVTDEPLECTSGAGVRMTGTSVSTPLTTETPIVATEGGMEEITVASAESTSGAAEVCSNADKCVSARRMGRVEKFFSNIFKRRGAGVDTTRDSQRSHIGLLGGMWQAGASVLRQRTETTEKSPFGAEHRLKGIRCSGSVTYKKSPVRTSQGGNAVSGCSSSSNCDISSNNSTSISVIATTNASAAELNENFEHSASNITTTVTPTATAAARAQLSQSPPATQPPTRLPVNSPRLHASVTFQVPSYDKTPANTHSMGTAINGGNGTANVNSNNNSNTTTPTHGRQQQLHRGILKSRTPPPRPPPPFKAAPPPLQKRVVATISPTKIERVQIQDKSSSLGDPLTEPGEYENLPFHGLQTAPNKFSTTLTNFNNNTNVVRVAPRPKRLNGNIGQQQHQQQQYEQDQCDQQFQYHQHQQQQHQYNTMQYVGGGGRLMATNQQHQQAHTMNSHNKGMLLQHHQQHMLTSMADGSETIGGGDNGGAGHAASGGSGYMNGGIGGTAPHQTSYNLNNCFPKSYTEYYHQQQQQKQQSSVSNNTSSAQLLNAIEHDYPTYAVVERSSASAAGLDIGGSDVAGVRTCPPPTAVSTNPFLAITNFKKYDTGNSPADNAYQPHILDISGTGSMQRNGKRKPMIDGKMEDKKFYSLKFTGGGGKNKASHPPHKSPASGVLNASMIFPGNNSNKCKRHHSFAGGSIGDIDSVGPGAQQTSHQIKSSALMRFYDPPAYENLAADNAAAVQVHECAVEAHPSPAAGGMSGTATILLHPQPTASGSGTSGTSAQAGQSGHKKKHHHRQHQQKDDFNLIEPERLSIYRSDSGISNSSYECVTPVPPPPGSTRGATVLGDTPPPKTPKGSKLSKHSAASGGANLVNSVNYKNSMRQSSSSKGNAVVSGTSLPVYMNVDGYPSASYERSCSPNSTLVNSSYESASSSQNDGHGGPGSTDPTSLSSCNSLYSSGTGTLIGVAPLMKTGTGMTASRCGLHQKPAEITTPEEYEQYQLGHHHHSSSSLSVASTVSASGTRRCKKQQSTLAPAGSVTGIEHFGIGVTNPFLASECVSTATACAFNTTATDHSLSAHGIGKKLRRKTISDPYAHIRYITYGNDHSNSHRAAECQTHAHNHPAKCTVGALKATDKQQQQAKSQQQHDNNNGRQREQHQQSLLIQRKSCGGNNGNSKDIVSQQRRLVPLGGNADEGDVVAIDATKKISTTEENFTGHSDGCADDITNLILPQIEDEESATITLASTVDYLGRRPVKLPLRKYHSFHFQPSQTVAGTLRHCKLQQLRMQMQEKQQQRAPITMPDDVKESVRPEPLSPAGTAAPTSSKRYAVEGGPLVFRPLSWHEQRIFKPISSPVDAREAPAIMGRMAPQIDETITENTRQTFKLTTAEAEEEEEKSEMSEELAEEIKQITRSAQLPHVSLNPAASLEALEALTKHHPELIYATKPGTRQNLHKQLALPKQWTQQSIDEKQQTTGNLSKDFDEKESGGINTEDADRNDVTVDDDEEDLGYSFCEDYDDDDDELESEEMKSSAAESQGIGLTADEQRTSVTAESPRVVLSAGRNGGQVKYMLRQSYREVHI
ncbi:PREDICTED: uncharacterized protein LOC108365246 [Rhagoletis zephyria]|uniref:uncharacterized protein LOC108365246 n=1 Tax=Rhagoletis zephyria TaxID=28612 RepID=UPI000811757E|nr:PREDICTED: uncharacterized protein LOC108365246 [Rhagoletis zephyria]